MLANCVTSRVKVSSQQQIVTLSNLLDHVYKFTSKPNQHAQLSLKHVLNQSCFYSSWYSFLTSCCRGRNENERQTHNSTDRHTEDAVIEQQPLRRSEDHVDGDVSQLRNDEALEKMNGDRFRQMKEMTETTGNDDSSTILCCSTKLLRDDQVSKFFCYSCYSLSIMHIGMLCPSYQGEVIFISLQTYIAPVLVLMPGLHSRRRREAKKRHLDQYGCSIFFQQGNIQFWEYFQVERFFQKLWPLLYKRAKFTVCQVYHALIIFFAAQQNCSETTRLAYLKRAFQYDVILKSPILWDFISFSWYGQNVKLHTRYTFRFYGHRNTKLSRFACEIMR